MTRLVWNQPSQKRYENGVDRGVLYPESGDGVAWNGLTTVEESFSGGEINSFYFEGIKTLDLANPKTFQATISAFSAPPEFASCAGERSIIPGFILTRQPRTRFGFSYRTMINERDYKLHLVYNALATPSSRGYSTLNDSPEPTTLSWRVDAVPPKSTTYRPSAHYVLDSTKTSKDAMLNVEHILYGSAFTEPRLPSVDELIDIVSFWDPYLIVPPVPFKIETNRLLNPVPSGIAHYAYSNGTLTYEDEALHYVNTTGFANFLPDTVNQLVPALPGDTVEARFLYKGVGWRTAIWHVCDANGVILQQFSVTLPPTADWVELICKGTITHPAAKFARFVQLVYGNSVNGYGDHWLKNLIVHPVNESGPYFDPNTPDNSQYDYAWLGTPNNSPSVRSTKTVANLVPGVGDLTKTKVDGLYRSISTTRLVKTASGGLYRLEQ